jgi:integrase
LYDPHDPYEPPAPYSQIYKDHLYDGEIAYADSALRNFLEYLKKRGWYDNSVVIVVGDHGESLGEHGEYTHGIFLYDATTRIDRPAKIKLAEGERQRDRVLTAEEQTAYLSACPQPWRDCATLMLDEGFRPGEVFTLTWPQLFFNQNGTGLIQILEGKSKAARRVLPMTPRVYQLLSTRHESLARPSNGWVFPSGARCAHFNENVAKDQHKKALEDSGIMRFEPYVLRHTALTQLGEASGGDVFALAKIAGHSSITITQRYIHPQAAAIERVFTGLKRSRERVGTKLGTERKRRDVGSLKSGR